MRGKASNWVDASVDQWLYVSRVGFRFRVWRKYKKKDKMVGTVIVNNAGLRWRKPNGKVLKAVRWREVADWLGA